MVEIWCTTYTYPTLSNKELSMDRICAEEEV